MELLREGLRRLLPLALRQDLHHQWRRLQDTCRGLHFVCESGELVQGDPLCITQPVHRTSTYANKLINLQRAAQRLDHQLIAPGADWSFWHVVGRPDAAGGFVTGRNLVAGKLVEQTGGGLCQVASLLYLLALQSGLVVCERHAHSVDIYREAERFTPLGADATVVWGFKDLRLRNPYPFPVMLRVLLAGGMLCGELHGARALAARQVEFVRERLAPARVRIHTLLDGQPYMATDYRTLHACD